MFVRALLLFMCMMACVMAESLFGSTTPSSTSYSDDSAVTIGLKFSPKVNGAITAIKFYKGSGNTGTHVAALYSSTGSQLYTGTFTSETTSGWQTLSFPGVSLSANAQYTAAVYLSKGHYAVTIPYSWPAQGVSLTGLAGTYNYGSAIAWPTQTFNNANYFVDVQFNPSGPTPAPTAKPTSGPTPVPTAKPTAGPTKAPTTKPTSGPTSSPTPKPPTPAPSKAPTSQPTAKPTPGPTSSPSGWPDATNTGVVGCPSLTKVNNGDEIVLSTFGQVYQNVELINPATFSVRAANITIRCVKMNGIGYFGVDNTDYDAAINLVIDRMDIDGQDATSGSIGLLLHDAAVTKVHIYQTGDGIHIGGSHVSIKDSYIHDLINNEEAHTDAIQCFGGNDGLYIEHNSLWSRDTSDILLGKESGSESVNVVINNNRFMSVGTPPPAYLLYLSGTNTQVTNNRFTRRYTYGPCTLITSNAFVWTNNVWDDDSTPVPRCG